MFYKSELNELRKEVNTLRAAITSLRLNWISEKGDYLFNVGDKVEILRGRFKIHQRGYSDRSYQEARYIDMMFKSGFWVENFVPYYTLISLDSDELISLEEKDLVKELAELKCINQNIKRKKK